MSHHHHHHREPEKNELKAPESTSKPIFPMFEKTDLSILSIIKQFLSPTGQKIVDCLISISGGNDLNDIPLDIPGLISQLNIKGENNSLQELLTSLMNAMAGENKGALNPVLLNTLMTILNAKKKNESKKENELDLI